MRVQSHVRMPVTPPTAPPPLFEGRFSKSEGPIQLIEPHPDGLLITGIVADRTPDCAGEWLDVDKSWPLFEARMARMKASSNGKNLLPVRVQHRSDRPCGHVVAMWKDADRLMVKALIVDAEACRWIKAGTLSQLSLGGIYRGRETQPDGSVAVVAAPREISLVDCGCSPNARIVAVEEQPADFQKAWDQARASIQEAADSIRHAFHKSTEGETNMGKTCANCNSKAQKAEEHVKAVKALRDEIAACSKAGHPSSYADAQEPGRGGIRGDAFGDHTENFARAASAGSFYKRVGLNPEQLEATGGLVKAG